MNSYIRRLKEEQPTPVSVPLRIDCSVEYELPKSAKPPIGNKNEPLLMIHPQHYREKESKRHSAFINNIPKKKNISRSTQSISEQLLRLGKSLFDQNLLKLDNECFVNDYPSFETPSISFQPKTSSHCSSFQPLTPLNSASTTPEVPSLDYYPVWHGGKSTGINASLQFHPDVHEVSEIPTTNIPERDDLSHITPSTATDSDKPWRYSWMVERVCRGADPKCHIPTQDRSKKHFCNNKDNITSRVSKGIPVKKKSTYSGTPKINIHSISSAGEGSVPASPFCQQQPAVGIAAIAPTTLNTYRYYSPSMTSTTVEDDRHSLIRHQPWSATKAPECTSLFSIPSVDQVIKQSLIETTCPEVPPQLSSTRKRTSGCTPSWNSNGYRNKDSKINIHSISSAGEGSVPASPFCQQQPAVGTAAIAPTTLNTYRYYSPSMTSTTVEDDRHSLIRHQPWSATKAPECTSLFSLPSVDQVIKQSLIETTCPEVPPPEVPPQLSSTRKRTSGCTHSWNSNGYRNKDSSFNERNRNLAFESNILSRKSPGMSETANRRLRVLCPATSFNPPSYKNTQNYGVHWNTCTAASSREQPNLYSTHNSATTITSNKFSVGSNPNETPYLQQHPMTRTLWNYAP